jgi:hypothetical protein
METARVAKMSSLLIVGACFVLTSGTAAAGDQKEKYPAQAGGVIPMESVESFPAEIDPMYVGCFYTVPIQAVYQCPAAIAQQPGSQVAYLRVNTAAGLLGGQPWLYHR